MFTVNHMRMLPFLWLGKMCINFSQRLNFGGSNLPGRLVSGVAPNLLPALASQLKEGCILITGTNGKTTTAYLLSSILSRSGRKIVHNRSGANLISGITTSFISESSWLGELGADLGVIEVDEATIPAAASQLKVKGIIVTNLFRDQLDRYGEIENTLRLIEKGLRKVRPDGFVLLNADDPLVASLRQKMEARVIFYGINCLRPGSKIRNEQASDVKTCYRCGKKYFYLYTHYAHLGLYACPGCGIRRPQPQYYIFSRQKITDTSTLIGVRAPDCSFQILLNIPGFYNLYNALAALSCSMVLGADKKTIAHVLQDFSASFGRMEMLEIEQKKVFIALIKNPAGANEVLRTLFETEATFTLMIVINDRYADGIDISWLWDVDFEVLADIQDKIKGIFCSGTRGEDMSLRLKYAGLQSRLIMSEEDIKKAFLDSLNHTPAGGVLQVLPTYTAMLELRKIINEMGYGKKFWEV